MIQSIKKLFGFGPEINFAELRKNGAVIIDVRTPAEFRSGHISGATNIPLQLLASNLNRLKKNIPIITCCASGARSLSAKKILHSNGFSKVHNGGNWTSLERKI